ncbi:MAG: ABC transporter ATP-binding protein [Candidatus Methylacidiphilales bacterium]
MARIFAYIRNYPGFAIATLACAVLSTLAGFVYPKLTGWIINDVIAANRSEQLPWLVGGIVVAFFLRDFLNSVRIILNNTFEQHVIFDLRSELYAAMQRLPAGWFDNRSTGDLLTRVSEDVTSMERVLIDGIEQGVVAVLQIIGVTAFLLWINPALALWSMLPVPFLIAGASWYTLTAHQRYRIQRRAVSAMNSLLLDNLQGIRQIKSFGVEQRELAHFQQKADAVRHGNLVVMKAWALYNPTMTFLGATGAALVLYFGGLDVLQGRMTLGGLVTFLLFVGMLYEPISRLHSLNQLVQSGRAAAERVFRILDTPQEPEPSHPAVLPPRSSDGRRVEYRGVEFAYEPNRPVLHRIDILARPGSMIALVGPTGAGKSSIVNLLPRFYERTGGLIEIDGVDIRDLPTSQLRREIAVVTQEAFLFNATIRENLLLGDPNADDSRLFDVLSHARAADFVSRMPKGLDTIVGERGIKLSVGEKQRLSIARALLKDAPILILDEATASVDTATEQLIREALDHLLQRRTSFVIAHRLSTIRSADEICVIDQGRILERGHHADLLRSGGLYAELCKAQAGDETIEETFERVRRNSDSGPRFEQLSRLHR